MSTPPHRRPKPATIVLVPLVAALVLTLFAWPSARLAPRDLPIGVVGPPAAAHPLERNLAARDGAFEVRRYASESAARAAIEDRDVYGAFVATTRGAKVLTSTAASPAVAQMLAHAAAEGDRPAEVQDVVAASAAGGGLPSSVLPLVLAGALTGILSGLLAAGPLRRAGLVVGGSLLTGLAATAIVQSWLGVVEGDWLANAAALTLTIMAIAAFVAGLYALLGEAGAILGLLTMILIGNPFSGVGSAPELLPRPVGDIGQLMPPGAGGNLLRSTGYFDGAAAGGHVAVLAAWALAGFAALILAGARGRRAGAVAAPAAA
jgi:hypothetical protein